MYHGTKCADIEAFKVIDREGSPPDFGRGVYFTSNLLQAEKWACKNGTGGIVYECTLDCESFSMLSINNSEDDDLYYTLYLCRLGLEDIVPDAVGGFSEADVVFGCMLRNPKSFCKKAALFNDGDMTFEEFKKHTQLFQGNMNQYCMKTDSVLKLINNTAWKFHIVDVVNGKYVIKETIDIPAPV